ncbi:hypothetical protein Taro_012479 [Colocasia esculenta]|uniref:Uncharacterized protein n=1 Tax=Colocasia esculenta TaxID=4460 RepID=A0A843U8U8_COLES|nr:hypothetical protein [Colocasia esculenta]
MPLGPPATPFLRRVALPPQPQQAFEEMSSGGEPLGCSSSSSSSPSTLLLLPVLPWSSWTSTGTRLGVLARSLAAGGNGGGVPSCSGATEKEAAAADAARSFAPGKHRKWAARPRFGAVCSGRHRCHPLAWAGRSRHRSARAPSGRAAASCGIRIAIWRAFFCSGQAAAGSTSPPPPCAGRHRSPRDAKVESIIRHVDGHHRAITKQSGRQAFQVKKWRSFGDLGTEEVQCLRDLGFVLDDGSVTPGMLEVMLGLRGGELEGTKVVRRPYLPEAWLVERSEPPALDWVGGGSAAYVKEQLRFWAQAVAYNVRQEC